MGRSTHLRESVEPLVSAYDCAMLDLDGVVYRGPRAVDGVPEVLARARAGGMHLAFVTNNAARTPASVAAHLAELGVRAQAADVVTSAQAAAHELAQLVPAASTVLVVGGAGLEAAVTELGFVPAKSRAKQPSAVVQGFDRSIGWAELAEAAYAVQSGVPWVASNLDLTMPTADGIAPGNGTLVDAVAAAVGRRPDTVAGKPFRPLFDETLRRTGSCRPLVVGDRLDTDIAGANRYGADALMVMTGVTDVQALCVAAVNRPSYVSWTLAGLLDPHGTPTPADDGWELGGWRVVVHDGEFVVPSSGHSADDGLRAAVAAAWGWLDQHPGRSIGVGGLGPLGQHR